MPVSDYTPNVDAVAAYVRARTKTRGGAEAGTFNPSSAPDSDLTRPTAEDVNALIDQSVGWMSDIIGSDLDPKYQPAASRVAALRSAMLTELTFWPEQVNTGRSTYPQLKALFDEEWKDLLASMGIGIDQPGGGPATIDAGMPSYGGFPTTAIGMETAW